MGNNFVCTILLTLTCQCRLSELARQALHRAAIWLATADLPLSPTVDPGWIATTPSPRTYPSIACGKGCSSKPLRGRRRARP